MDVIGSYRLAPLRVADLMSAPVAIPSSSTVREAAMLLARSGSSAVPILSPAHVSDRILGEADIHRRLSEVTRGFYAPEEFRTAVPLMAGGLPPEMTRDFARVGWGSAGELARRVDAVRPSDPLRVALEAMRRQGLSTLPVLVDGRLVGILHADAMTLRLVEYVSSQER